MKFCHYYRDVVKIPDTTEVFNVKDDLFLFATKELSQLSTWNAQFGAKVHPFSDEVVRYFIGRYPVVEVESRLYQSYFDMATSDNLNEVFLKIVELVEMDNGTIKHAFKKLVFETENGRVVITPTCLTFQEDKAYEQYASDMESGA